MIANSVRLTVAKCGKIAHEKQTSEAWHFRNT